MKGGTITIVNPKVQVQDQTFVNASGQAVPSSQFSNQPGMVRDGQVYPTLP